VVTFHGRLVAATSDGVYQYVLAASRPASVAWWMVLVAGAAVLGALALAVLGFERIRPRIGRRRAVAEPAYQYVYERPFHGFESYMTGVAGLSPPPVHEPPPRVVAAPPAARFAGVEAYMARRASEPASPLTALPARPTSQPATQVVLSAPAERFVGVEAYMAQLAGQPALPPLHEPVPRVGLPPPPLPEPSREVWMPVPPADSAPPADALERTRRLPPPALPETRVLKPRRS
jgi:hypothetical protein